MRRRRRSYAGRYHAALRRFLGRGPRAGLRSAEGLGTRAVALGLETLDVARIHERAIRFLVPPGGSAAACAAIVRRTGLFFAEAVAPIEKTHRAALDANAELKRLVEALRRRTADLSRSNSELRREIVRRRAVEGSLRINERQQRRMLKQSGVLETQLRHLSRQVLSGQEEERKRISRELHDQVAQTLTGINVELANLKREAAHGAEDIGSKISSAQRLVEKSVDIVHRFARELRPAVLDDLGLIPALHSFLKRYAMETGVRIRFTTCPARQVEKLNVAARTVFYRVALEALTNVARHAHATRADVTLERKPETIRLKVRDNGRSFPVQRILGSPRNLRLGLVGMRERLQMVGGSFAVESSPGRGTTILAQIPFANGNSV